LYWYEEVEEVARLKINVYRNIRVIEPLIYNKSTKKNFKKKLKINKKNPTLVVVLTTHSSLSFTSST
jgi:hypothetical protein